MNLSVEQLKSVTVILNFNKITVQIAKFPEISHFFNQHDSQLSRPSYNCRVTLELRNSSVKVPITPKYFFRLNNSLHLFETHCTFLHLFSPNLDFLQAVKVTKSDHHLFHDRASKGYGSIPGLMSQTYLHACLQRLNTMQISL